MFKIFVLCSLLVTIRCLPTDQEVDKVAVPIENDPTPQGISVPIEQVLKADTPKEEKLVDETSLKVTADVPLGTIDNSPAVDTENSPDTEGADKTRLLLLLSKFNTTG